VIQADVLIREGLVLSDLAALSGLLRACPIFRKDEIETALQLVEDGIAKGEKSDYRFVLARCGDQVVGYCCYGKVACAVHSFDLYWIVVDADVQGRGIGRQLLAAAEDRIRASGGRHVYVETSTRPEFERARRFYSSCGYQVQCMQPDFYSPGDGKVTMRKLLS